MKVGRFEMTRNVVSTFKERYQGFYSSEIPTPTYIFILHETRRHFCRRHVSYLLPAKQTRSGNAVIGNESKNIGLQARLPSLSNFSAPYWFITSDPDLLP